jgi:hypothetical protein
MTTYLVGVHIDDHTLTQYDLLLRLLDDLWETGRIMTRSRHLFRQLRLRRGRFGTKPASLGCGNNRVLSLELIEIMPIPIMSVLRLQNPTREKVRAWMKWYDLPIKEPMPAHAMLKQPLLLQPDTPLRSLIAS